MKTRMTATRMRMKKKKTTTMMMMRMRMERREDLEKTSKWPTPRRCSRPLTRRSTRTRAMVANGNEGLRSSNV